MALKKFVFQIPYSLDNHLIKQNLQKIIHAACSLNCGNHQIIRVNTGKINDISRMVGKLRKKNTLGSAVALSEWVKLIRSFIKVYYGRNEVRSVSAHKKALLL